MFTSLSANVRNILAAMPGLVFIPAPTNEILAMESSLTTPAAPILVAMSSTIDCATFMSALGTVKLMSVKPSAEVFCTIMSTFTFACASGSNRPADTPGRSGTLRTVTLASLTSVTTPEMMGSSMEGS